MKSKGEIEQSIINITTKILHEYPELMKYINEMPMNNSEDIELNLESLNEYYYSLEELLNKYAKTHRKTDFNKN